VERSGAERNPARSGESNEGRFRSLRRRALPLRFLFLKAVLAFPFSFLRQQGWIVSSGGAPVNRPGLTCYPYNREAYTLSFPSPEERAETTL
jgi:hypothetical protein